MNPEKVTHYITVMQEGLSDEELYDRALYDRRFVLQHFDEIDTYVKILSDSQRANGQEMDETATIRQAIHDFKFDYYCRVLGRDGENMKIRTFLQQHMREVESVSLNGNMLELMSEGAVDEKTALQIGIRRAKRDHYLGLYYSNVQPDTIEDKDTFEYERAEMRSFINNHIDEIETTIENKRYMAEYEEGGARFEQEIVKEAIDELIQADKTRKSQISVAGIQKAVGEYGKNNDGR